MHHSLLLSVGLEVNILGKTGTHDKEAELEAVISILPFFRSVFWNILFNHHGFQCIYMWVMVLHAFLKGRYAIMQ